MSTHNICFHGEIRKNFCLDILLIWSRDTLFQYFRILFKFQGGYSVDGLGSLSNSASSIDSSYVSSQ